MKTQYYVIVKDFCVSHHVEESFVLVLQEYDLVDLIFINKEAYIHKEELPKLEKMVRLYRELGINPEGIDAVQRLSQKIEDMQQELYFLKNKLQRFDEY